MLSTPLFPKLPKTLCVVVLLAIGSAEYIEHLATTVIENYIFQHVPGCRNTMSIEKTMDLQLDEAYDLRHYQYSVRQKYYEMLMVPTNHDLKLCLYV